MTLDVSPPVLFGPASCPSIWSGLAAFMADPAFPGRGCFFTGFLRAFPHEVPRSLFPVPVFVPGLLLKGERVVSA